MKISGVTITGADDAVDPRDLLKISDRFPFVEWGILFRGKDKPAKPRYPSREWMRELASCSDLTAAPFVALHLCGDGLINTVLVDPPTEIIPCASFWDRIQLNIGAMEISEEMARNLRQSMARHDGSMSPFVQWILQIQGTSEQRQARIKLAEQLSPAENDAVTDDFPDGSWHVSVLFDASGGRGVAPDGWRWPMPAPWKQFGYAGGLGPENVIDAVRSMPSGTDTGEGPLPPWIDMESGVRTEDRLDLDKVVEVLERMRPAAEAGAKILQRVKEWS